MTYRSSKLVHRCARDEATKKRQRKKPNSGKLGIRRDHPRRRSGMKFCMVGGLWMIVLRFEFHQYRLSGFGAVGGRNLPIPMDLAIGLYNSLYYRTSRDKYMWHKCLLLRTKLITRVKSRKAIIRASEIGGGISKFGEGKFSPQDAWIWNICYPAEPSEHRISCFQRKRVMLLKCIGLQ